MIECIKTEATDATVAFVPILQSTHDIWLAAQNEYVQNVANQMGLGQKPGKFMLDYKANGDLAKVYMTWPDDLNPYLCGSALKQLPAQDFHLDGRLDDNVIASVIKAWGFACYRFDRYLKAKAVPTLVVDDAEAQQSALSAVNATALVRDLINTPADDMGPTEMSAVAEQFAKEHHACVSETVGDALLTEGFPSVHIVGRASHKAPRLLEINWGDESYPKVSLVGKGVCFDTGGNNMKAAQFMRWMKKDMGGGAHVLGLAQMIMDHQLPLNLQVLIPTVENSVSGNAFRQGDVVTTRSGQSIEIGHTDAEGRVILADALTYACEREPELVIDFATLTGAARVAMGPTVTPFFSNRQEILDGIFDKSAETHDETWPLPLQQSYKKYIKSTVADLNNSASLPQAGCITAALFLEHFVTPETPWVHVDTFGWNFGDRTGGTEGGEALGMVTVFEWLKDKYAA